MVSNELYLAVLPLIHLGKKDFGWTEETVTLFPDKKFATEFFADEVEGYLAVLKNRTNLLIGGHVKKFEITTENTEDGRVIVKVIQHVE